MLSSFLRAGLRHLLRNRAYTGLNILGLSAGLACFAIIGMWMKQQLSFDRMHAHGDRIFQVDATVLDERSQYDQAITPAPLTHALANGLPEIENTLRIDVNEAVVRSGTQQFVEGGIIATDASFFDFFDFKLIKGDPLTALAEPYSVVVSERTAKKYFGDRDPLNESLRIFQYDPDGNGAEYKITGVIEDCPANSHFDYSMLISFKTIEVAEPETMGDAGWRNSEYYSYVMLKPMASPSGTEAKFPAVLRNYSASQAASRKAEYNYFLTPLSDIHFSTDIKHQIQAGTSMAHLLIFGAIGMIVLLLACINYVSLATASSIDEFSKVGIRKILGASNRQVVIQYLVESWLIAVVAVIVSLVWIELGTPVFEDIFAANLTGLYTPGSLLTLFGIGSLTGIVSGIYPSLVLSSFSAIRISKGQLSRGLSGIRTRKALVVLQYSITMVLVTGILVVRKQLDYIATKDLGFTKDNLVVFATNGSPEVIPGYDAFANEVMTIPGVSAIARSNTGIGGGLDTTPAMAETIEGKRFSTNVFTARIDHHYVDTYQMGLISGRNFIPGDASDSSRGYLINEAAARAYGYADPQDAIGRFFSIGKRAGEVIGVVRDFHYAALREKIEPAALYLLNGYFSRITIRVDGKADHNRTLAAITHTWKKHFPETVADFSFLADRLEGSYRAEDRFSKTFFIFSIISVTIACLGLFALVSYHVERRSREIGIRKVLGASVAGISAMLSFEFMSLVLVACVVGTPIGLYIMDRWLQNFAYHVDVGAGVFIAAVALNLFIATATVAVKTVRSALRNPVDALRSE